MAQKNDSRKKAGKKINTSMSIVIIIAAAVGFYMIYSFLFARITKIHTETAQTVTIDDSIQTTGVAIRDETVITSNVSGVAVSVVENGGKVYKGETIVSSFSSESAAQAYLRIIEIDKALEDFENMSTAGEENAVEMGSLEKQLVNRLNEYSRCLYGGEIGGAVDASEEILYLLNKGQIATKQVENFDTRVAELQAERARLSQVCAETPKSLCAPMSGYYINKVDGYEGLLSTEILDGLTPEKFERILEEPAQTYSSNVIGKIADDYVWNIVCTVPFETVEGLKEGRYYTIFLPYSDTESIEAKLASITPDENGEKTLLVFRCTYMVSGLASFRSQPIIIQKKSFTGLGVSLSAITYKEETSEVSSSDGFVVAQTEKIPGVYILWGNEVKFRRIEELYRDGDTVVCAVTGRSGWLKMYDEVITDNDNMYDGKIVNAD